MNRSMIGQGTGINKEFVKKVAQTYGLMENNRLPYPNTSKVRSQNGEVKTLYNGDNFRTIYLPKSHVEVIIKQFGFPRVREVIR